MTCCEVADFLGEYFAGDLTPAEHATFEAHVAACPECAAYLRSYRDTIRLVKDACRDADDAMPEGVPERLVRAILAARSRRPPGRGRRNPDAQ